MHFRGRSGYAKAFTVPKPLQNGVCTRGWRPCRRATAPVATHADTTALSTKRPIVTSLRAMVRLRHESITVHRLAPPRVPRTLVAGRCAAPAILSAQAPPIMPRFKTMLSFAPFALVLLPDVVSAQATTPADPDAAPADIVVFGRGEAKIGTAGAASE